MGASILALSVLSIAELSANRTAEASLWSEQDIDKLIQMYLSQYGSQNVNATPQPQPTPQPTDGIATSTNNTPSSSSSANHDISIKIHTLVNNLRQQNGVAPLAYNAQVEAIAYAHSKDMATRNFFDHVNPDKKNPGDRLAAGGFTKLSAWGENIAMFRTSSLPSYTSDQIAQQIFKQWLNSPEHKQNMLRAVFKEEGIGLYVDGNSNSVFATEDFITQQNAKPQAQTQQNPIQTPSPTYTPTPTTTTTDTPTTTTTANTNLYDDFSGGTYTLSDGQTSPNGKWHDRYNGYGSAGVTTDKVTGKNVFYEKPGIANSPSTINPDGKTTSGTHSALVLSTQKWQNFKLSLDMRTNQQLRQGTPNSWEVAWVMFRFADDWHHYYFVLKTTGIEFGKKDTNCQCEQQVFLYTANSPIVRLGEWEHVDIQVIGNHITVWLNGTKVVDKVDDTMSSVLSSGAIGLYSEDASVNYANVHVTPL